MNHVGKNCLQYQKLLDKQTVRTQWNLTSAQYLISELSQYKHLIWILDWIRTSCNQSKHVGCLIKSTEGSYCVQTLVFFLSYCFSLGV